MPKPGVLRNLRVKRVDLVDAGANFDSRTGDGAHIMLFKRDVSKDGPTLAAVHVNTIAGRKKKPTLPLPPNKETNVAKTLKDFIKSALGLMSETDVEKRQLALDALVKAADENDALSGGSKEDNNHIGPIAPEHVQALKAQHDQLGKMIGAYGAGPHPDGHPVHTMKALHSGMGEMLKAAGVDCGMGGEDEPGALGVAKAAKAAADATEAAKLKEQEIIMDAQVTKRMTDLEKRATDAEAAVLVEKNLRLDREMVDILKGFKHTPVDAEKDVAEFRKMKETNPAGFERVIALMKAADAQLSDSTLYKNLGVNGGGGDLGANSAWAQIEAKADALIEKSTDMTREKAIEKVMLANPKLVKQYRAEQQ